MDSGVNMRRIHRQKYAREAEASEYLIAMY